MKRNVTCIICPKGCGIMAEIQGQCVHVSGNNCSKGEAYAINECLHPVRTVTATIRVANRYNTMVSVKTRAPVAKEHIMDVMTALRQISVDAPVAIGDVVLADLYGTEIVATNQID